ncbi:MAG: YcxB family protein [Clostridia bacterium]|nr:YcxB family protein [Clostridia bacterium]
MAVSIWIWLPFVPQPKRKDLITMKINCTKNFSRRLLALMLAVLTLTAACCLTVSAESAGDTFQVPSTNMSFTLPEGTYLISPKTPSSDPVWMQAKILDPSGKVMEMMESNISAEIYADENKCLIAVSMKESDYSKAVFNLNDLTEEERASFIEYMSPTSADGSTTGTVSWVEHPQVPFFCVDIESTALGEEPVYERLYCTIVDGILISFDLYTGTDPVPAEYDALLQAVVSSSVFSEFKASPRSRMGSNSFWIIFLLCLMIALIVGFFVYRSVSRKREKKQKAILADRLVEYRRSKAGNEDEGTGSLMFVNETLHDDVAIKKFANYHAYSRHLFVPILTTALGITAIAVIGINGIQDNLLMVLLMVGCVVFSLYKSVTAGSTITKNLIRVFGKLRSRKGAFYFYEGDFRITGLQASNLQPYFQITRMSETKEYFYLYFGEDNAYYVSKDGFTKGDADEFRRFMKEKLGKRFK